MGQMAPENLVRVTSSSAELSEAINSMFEWYQEAEVCLVFLPDMPSPGDISRDLPRCRWFTRGWTLQELLAPGAVWFFDSAWEFMGEKRDRALRHLIINITAIPESLLAGSAGLSDYSNSVRMSWAANRQTTRVEDIAYCLMGIFDIKMPLIYGEGKKAFQRLQEEIVKSSDDASIFAWTGKADGWGAPLYSGIYAESPAQFEHSDHPPLRDAIVHGISVTNRGIHIRISLGVSYSTAEANTYTYVLRLGRVYDARGHPTTLGIYLRQVGPGYFVRYFPEQLPRFETALLFKSLIEDIYIATAIPPSVSRHPVGGYIEHTSTNYVGSLGSALKFLLHDGMMLTDCYPTRNWDMQDQCFFTNSPSGLDWATFCVSGRVQVGPASFPREEVDLNLMCICFNWNGATETKPIHGLIINRNLHSVQSQVMMHLYLKDVDVEQEANLLIMRGLGAAAPEVMVNCVPKDPARAASPRKAKVRLMFNKIQDAARPEDNRGRMTTSVWLDVQPENGSEVD